MSDPVGPVITKASSRKRSLSLRWEGFVENVGFELGVMDGDSGDNDYEEGGLTNRWGDKSIQKLVRLTKWTWKLIPH